MAEERSGQTAPAGRATPSLLDDALQWRNIGPHRGGRVVAVAGDVSDPMVHYFGGVGGVWKTIDGGTYWENVSDGYFKSSAVGAIAVSESDPRIIYVGMGESCAAVPRLHWTSKADGVYRSTDSGKTWENMGLENTRHIARIRIHPSDPNLVYVAVPGHFEGPHDERGVFRSKDGGVNWEQVLFRSEQAGAVDLSIDANNPRVIYAAMWDFRRHFWNSYNGGPDSSIYKSTDGGDTWTELTGNPGLPAGTLGRIGIAASPAKPDRVFALIQRASGGGGLYRSDDAGANWEHMTDDPLLIGRPHYYIHVIPDPQDAETVYVMCRHVLRSVDGGRNFEVRPSTHKDNHDLWMDPADSSRMINGNDGGACVSFNGGASWSTIHNQPTAEFYHLTTDNRFPYRVYGTQQDNTALSTPSRSSNEGILWNESYQVGSSESGHIVVRPDNPDIIFSGAIGSSPGAGGTMIRYDRNAEQSRLVTVWPDAMTYTFEERRYRFQWDSPLAISPHDPNVLYAAGNVVFRSTDQGTSWEPISPDLTRNDMAEREEIDQETNIAPYERCTIFRVAESVHERGVLWAGSDDGLVHVSRDDGKSWENVTPPGTPEWSMVSGLEPSPHDPAAAYVAATSYQHGDYRPYLFKTGDYGKTWETIVSGIKDTDFTRVVREDPGRRGLLYAGTEDGVYLSFDDGNSWQPLNLNLPAVPIHDMVVKDGDLVVATHGRAFWILDDLSMLHQIADLKTEPSVHLFTPGPTYRMIRQPSFWMGSPPGPDRQFELTLGTAATYYLDETPEGEQVYRFVDAGHNPPDGVVVRYFLAQQPEGEITLTLVDPQGREIMSFSSEDRDEPGTLAEARQPRLSTHRGNNAFVWDMRHPVEVELEEAALSPSYKQPKGALAVPGTYQAELTVDGVSQTVSFEILKDPRISATQEELDEQLALQIRIREKVTEAHNAMYRLRSVRDQVDQWARRAASRLELQAVVDAAEELKGKLTSAEQAMIKRTGVEGWSGEQLRGSLRLPGPSGRLAKLADTVGLADGVPTRQSYDVFDDLGPQIDAQLERYQQIVENDVEAFINMVHELEVPEIDTDPASG